MRQYVYLALMLIVLAAPYARFPDTLPETQLQPAASWLLQLAEEVCRQYFEPRYEQLGIQISAKVSIGSTRARTTIKAVTTALLLYGGLRQTVDYLIKDGDALSRLVLIRLTPRHTTACRSSAAVGCRGPAGFGRQPSAPAVG